MRRCRFLEVPEVIIGLSAFFLNFFWEVVHTNFFTLKDSDFDTMLSGWLHCAWADVMITVGAFWLVSLTCRSRRWFLRLKPVNFLGFVMAGVVYTYFSEWANVHILRFWAYNESMPMIPLTNVGLTPILQWMIIPSIVILFARHHILLAEGAERGEVSS